MSNKALGITNLLCILFPMLLGIVAELTHDPSLANGGLVAVGGLFMIVFGIWASLRLARQPD